MISLAHETDAHGGPACLAKSPHLPSVVPGRHHCRWLDHEQNGAAAKGMRTVLDAARDRHPLTGTEHERFAPLYLELKPAFEHEKELILVLMLVPIGEATLDYRETDYTVTHGPERLVEPRVVRSTFGSQVDVC
jgi:hypothetical protein